MNKKEVLEVLDEMIQIQQHVEFLQHLATDKQLHTFRKIEVLIDNIIGNLHEKIGN